MLYLTFIKRVFLLLSAIFLLAVLASLYATYQDRREAAEEPRIMDPHLGEVTLYEDLPEAKGVNARLTSTIPSTRLSGPLHARDGDDLGVVQGDGRAYFLDISDPSEPRLIAPVDIRRDSLGNSDRFAGFHRDYALFGIGYDGLEVIEMKRRDGTEAQYHIFESRGLLLDYGYPEELLFHDSIAITALGIFDASDPLEPVAVRRFDEPITDALLMGDRLVTAGVTGISMFTLTRGEVELVERLKGGLPRGALKLLRLSERDFLAVSTGGGAAVLRVESLGRGLILEGVLNLRVEPGAAWVWKDLFFGLVRSFSGRVFAGFDLEKPESPRQSFVFKPPEEPVLVEARDGLFVMTFEGAKEESVLVIMLLRDKGPPERVARFRVPPVEALSIYKGHVYLSGPEGLAVYEVY